MVCAHVTVTEVQQQMIEILQHIQHTIYLTIHAAQILSIT